MGLPNRLRIIAYLDARQEAGELWSEIAQGNDAVEDHSSYAAFQQAQSVRDGAVRALANDPISLRVGAHIVDAMDLAADHLMATGATRTRQEAIAHSWTHALTLGLREPTPLERLPGLVEDYRQAKAADSSERYGLYRDLTTTLAQVDPAELRQAPQAVQGLVQQLRTAQAAEEQRAQELGLAPTVLSPAAKSVKLLPRQSFYEVVR